MPKDTPMMEQYHRLKREHGDSVLLFRLGDFYEMFEQDAVEASRILNIALTRRNDVPMCGFPYHAAEAYIAKLLREGRKIAVCEQREDPSAARGLVRREVVEIVSPGLIVNPNLLQNKHNNCIAACVMEHGRKKENLSLACASLDVSTGEFLTSFSEAGDALDHLLDEIEDNSIREMIYPEELDMADAFSAVFRKAKKIRPDVVFRPLPPHIFEKTFTREALDKQFSIIHPDALEIRDELEMVACGALIAYVKDSMKQELDHIRWVRPKHMEDILVIDSATRKNLELTENQLDGKEAGTLLTILDRTETAMGGRLLRKYIGNPSRKIDEINNRLGKIEFFLNSREKLESVRRALSRILDLERILSKLSVGKGNARDLVGLKTSLRWIAAVREELEGVSQFAEEVQDIADFSDLVGAIESGIVDSPPLSLKEGGIIRDGCDEKLDSFRKISAENREWINRYQQKEQERTGIGSLKVRYNKIVGYYIEVTKPNLHLVPGNYIKKQTLVGSERFTTEELAGHETLLLEAKESSNTLELALFEKICGEVLRRVEPLYGASRSIARIDAAAALAVAASENNYVKPEVVEENIVDIQGGRHPVVEKLGEERFIDNDLLLNDSDRRVMILTGPNMAGKSTFLRQSAIIVIMAHIGSFVPARSARIGLMDRVFSRVGMSDRLVKGESTFLVEMLETSRILHYASSRSFIIMDEIGRGTSTYDGLAIAWAVLEYLLDMNRVGAKVLFATHYHEITALGSRFGVVNYNATVREWNNSVIFLRKIVPGCASKSYGIEVAKMAGIPDSLINRAKTILQALETENVPLLLEHTVKDEHAEKNLKQEQAESPEEGPGGSLREGGEALQLALFPSPSDILINELGALDINSITPIEALNILDRLKKSLELRR